MGNRIGMQFRTYKVFPQIRVHVVNPYNKEERNKLSEGGLKSVGAGGDK